MCSLRFSGTVFRSWAIIFSQNPMVVFWTNGTLSLRFKNFKDEIILEVFKSNHLQLYEKEYWRLTGRFTKEYSEKTTKLPVSSKRNILHKIKRLQKKMENFCVKRVMVKTGIPISISEEEGRRILWKASLKWTLVQQKGILTPKKLKIEP